MSETDELLHSLRDNYHLTERVPMLAARLVSEREQAADRIEALEAGLMTVLEACDQGRMVERGAGGMTIEAQLKRSVINGVPAWPIEEARTLLKGTENDG